MPDRNLARDLGGLAYRKAAEAGSVEATGRSLRAAAARLRGSPRARQLLVHPLLPADRRDALIERLGAVGVAGEVIRTLAARRRLGLMGAVVRAYESEAARSAARTAVVVETASRLSKAERAALAAALERGLGRPVSLVVRANRGLIAGLRLRAGDLVVDGSALGALRRLERGLVSAS
jgi:F-type H+-transporting ATPase subunit delta